MLLGPWGREGTLHVMGEGGTEEGCSRLGARETKPCHLPSSMILLRTKSQDQNLTTESWRKVVKHTVCFRLCLCIKVPIKPHVLTAPRILKWDRGKGCKIIPRHQSTLPPQPGQDPSSTTFPSFQESWLLRSWSQSGKSNQRSRDEGWERTRECWRTGLKVDLRNRILGMGRSL